MLPQRRGQRTAPPPSPFELHQLAYAAYTACAIFSCIFQLWYDGIHESTPLLEIPTSALVELLATAGGQLCVLNLCVSFVVLALHTMQHLVFGKLRSIEWTRIWERLISYLMGQLVILGAVVEPDVAELVMWGCFSALVGLLAVYAGARTRART